MRTLKFTDSQKRGGQGRPINEARLQDLIDAAPAEYKIDPNKPYTDQQESIVKQAFAGADPAEALQAMRFSRSWQPQLDLFSLEFEADPADVPELERRIGEGKGQLEVLKAGGTTYEFSMKFPQKAQGFFMAALKPLFPKLAVKFANGFATGTFDNERTAANAYLAAFRIVNGWNPKKDGKYQPVDGVGQLPPEAAAGYAEAVKVVKGDGGAAVRVKGPLEFVKHAWQYRHANRDLAGQPLKLESNSTAVTYDMAWLVREFGKAPGKKQLSADDLRKMKFGLIFRSFLSDLEKKIQDDPNIKAKDGACAARLFQVGAKGLLDNYQKEFNNLRQHEEKVVPTTPVAVRRMKLFEDAKWYGAQIIDDVNGWIAAVCREHSQAHCFGRYKPKVDKNGNIDPDTNLRDDELKAKYPDNPEKVKNAIQRRDDKNYPYVKDGLGYDGQPKEGGWCVAGNGADWTGEWKSDGGRGNWSHVSTYFKCKAPGQRMPLIVYMEISSGRLYCSNMQYGNCGSGYRLNDNSGWCQYDFNTERNGVNDGGIEKKLAADNGFRKIYTKANIAAFGEYTAENAPGAKATHWKAISNPPDFNKIIRVKYTGKAGPMDMKTTDNGVVLIESRAEFLQLKDQLQKPYVTSVKLAFKDASSLFCDMNVSNLQVVDCSDVENASQLFKNSNLGKKDGQALDLVSTAKCKNMSQMFFRTTGITRLLNLDTGAATDIQYMFYKAETTNQRKLVLPALDLQNCRNMDNAFQDSPVAELNLKNIQDIETAEDALRGCWMLTKCTPLLFKHRSLGAFGIDRNEAAVNPELHIAGIFAGCDSLTKRPEFQQTLSDMVKYYVSDPEHLDVDDDGAAVLHSHDEAVIYGRHPERYKYNVTIDQADADNIFQDLTVVINRLKLVNVRTARRMFSESDIKRLSRIDVAGSPDLSDVSYMFASTNIKETPRVDFSSVKRALGIFDDCDELRSFGMEKDPNTKFGQFEVEYGVVSDARFDPVKYLFSDDPTNGSLPEEAMRRMDAGRVREYAMQFFKDAARTGAAAWVRGHVAEEDGKKRLLVAFAQDLDTYRDIVGKYPDLAEGISEVQPSETNYARFFRGRTVDFDGMGLAVRGRNGEDSQHMFADSDVKGLAYVKFEVEECDATGMFTDATVHGDLSINACPKSARFMFTRATIEGGLTIDDCSKARVCESMFEKCEFKGGKLKLGKFPELADASGMFSDCKGGLDAISVKDLGFSPEKLGMANFMFYGQNISDTELKFNLTGGSKCVGMFEGCTFPKDMTSITVETGDAARMFANTKGIENVDVLAVSGPNASGMFRESSVKVVGRLEIGAATKANDMFRDSQLEVILDASDGFAAAQTINIFNKTPAVETYGYDGEYLKLYLKGLQEK